MRSQLIGGSVTHSTPERQQSHAMLPTVREAATQAILLLDHPDHGHAEQALALVGAHDIEFRVVVLSQLFARGYRCAPAALLVSGGDATRAHQAATELIDWALDLEPSGAAKHAAKRLRECDPDDYATWAKLLLRVLDGTVFDQLDDPRSPAVRRVQELCNDLL